MGVWNGIKVMIKFRENERDKEAKEIEKAKILRLYNNDADNTDNPRKHYKTLLREKRAEQCRKMVAERVEKRKMELKEK